MESHNRSFELYPCQKIQDGGENNIKRNNSLTMCLKSVRVKKKISCRWRSDPE